MFVRPIESLVVTAAALLLTVVDSMLGDAASRILRASNYDNSCETDIDRLAAGSGDACSAPREPGCENVTQQPFGAATLSG